ncbi:MAG: hypothetical protein H0W50_09915 [Parachlamydiaceae bacterium]|nr:hypothetical protein [Parachlamydiaceae bacterium]
MKIFKVMAISSIFITAGTSLWGEVNQKQLTKNIRLQYEALDQKGDDNNFEITLRDPHLFWMDSKTDSPKILAELDHEGTLQIWVDVPNNTAKAESNGATHLICNAEEAKQPLNMTINGKITDTIDVDFSKIKDQLAAMKDGVFSEDDILTTLENVKKASLDASNVKLIFAQAMNDILLETAKINYAHTSGSTPEEFSVNLKAIAENKNNLFLEPERRETTISGKSSLSEWRKLASFARTPNWKNIPEGKSNWDIATKSELDASVAKMSMVSTLGDHPALSFEINQQMDLVSDWVNKMIALVKKNPPKNDGGPDAEYAKSIYKWIISPQTLPFFNQIPLQSNFDLNGSFEYSAAPAFVTEKGALNFSLLGKKQNGVKLSFVGDEKGSTGTVNTLLVGGRPLYNRLISMYNALEESLTPFFSKDEMAFKPISPELRDRLFQVLLAHTEDPKAQDKELKFVVKYSKDGVTIGGKPAMEFAKDLGGLFYEEPALKDETVQDELIEDEFMDVR